MARGEMKHEHERRFCGNIIYDGSTISQILFDGGYITLNDNGSPIYHFYVTDHQGNNRVVVDANGNVEERNDYYPYGALMSNSTTSIQRFKYNGKELNQHSYMLWYDYMARQTMPILGRFSSVDPLCEKYYGMSPYLYCAGNPVNCVDFDGRDWYQNNNTSYYTWFDGDAEKEGFTYIGKKGSLLGEFEPKINSILMDVYKKENGLYSEGSIVDIANPNKGAIIPSQFSKMNDFLDEFVFGYGPEISILTDKHPYTKELKTDKCIIESQERLREGNTAIPGQITKVKRSWGLWDVLFTPSIAQQFVGSYSFDSYTSKDNNHLLNIIYDTKNFRSLLYHIPGSGYLNHSRNSIVKPLSNTYQFYIWKSKK